MEHKHDASIEELDGMTAATILNLLESADISDHKGRMAQGIVNRLMVDLKRWIATFRANPALALETIESLDSDEKAIAIKQLNADSSPADALFEVKAYQEILKLPPELKIVAEGAMNARYLPPHSALLLARIHIEIDRLPAHIKPIAQERLKHKANALLSALTFALIYERIYRLPNSQKALLFSALSAGKSFDLALQLVDRAFKTRYRMILFFQEAPLLPFALMAQAPPSAPPK